MDSQHKVSRRRFMKDAALGALGLTLAACVPDSDSGKIQKLDFGRTGHKSARTLFGAYALANATQDEAEPVLELLLEYGINHIDTAPSYGMSERRLGPWMAKHRQDFFLATKTDQRRYKLARDQIHRSLDLLQVDQVDLLQLHNLVSPAEWEIAMGTDGVLEAAIEAREQGLTRFIGVTGHGLTAPVMHMRSLERFDFDSVLLPLNYPLFQNSQYVADFQDLVTLCQERNVAVQIIKSVARGPWGTRAKRYNTWYEPLDKQGAVDKAVHWILGRKRMFLNTAGDMGILSMILDAASRFRTAPSDEEMAQMLAEFDMQPLWT
jgi:aryl-alcohol dehydrogenase-like predicted oxidoreductase